MKFYVFLTLIALSSCVEPHLHLRIDQIQFEGDTRELYVGGNSNFIIPTLSDSVLKIRRIADGFSWQLNEPLYVKFNNINYNIKDFNEIEDVICYNDRKNVEELKRELEKSKNDKRQYIPISELLPDADSLNFNSLIHRKGKKAYEVIVLDTAIHVSLKNGKIFNTQLAGTIADSTLKVQIFNQNKSQLFNEGKLTSFVSLKPHQTNFRSNHFYIRSSTDNSTISFGASNQILLAKSDITEKDGIRLVLDNKFNAGNRFYLQDFSNFFRSVIGFVNHNNGRFEFVNDKLEHTQIGEKNEIIILRSPIDPSTSASIFIKEINFLTIIGTPIIIITIQCLIILLALNLKWSSPLFLGKRNNWKFYYITLILLVAVFCVVRVLVAAKLGYTYPYYWNAYYSGTTTSILIMPTVCLGWWLLKITVSYKELKQQAQFLFITSSSFMTIAIISGYYWYNLNLEYINADIARYELSQYDIFNRNSDIRYFLADKLYQIPLIIITLNCILYISICSKLGKLTARKLKLIIVSITISITKPFLRKFCVLLFSGAWFIFILGLFATSGNNFYGLLLIIGSLFLVSGSIWYVISDPTSLGSFKKLIIPIVVIISITCISVVIGDSGFLINLTLASLLCIYILFRLLFSQNNVWREKFALALTLCFVVGFFSVGKLFSFQEIGPERFQHRLSAFFDYDSYRNKGFRSTEAVSEFFAVVGSYTEREPNFDLLSDGNAIHPGISLPHSPIAVNDLSPLVSLIGPFQFNGVLVLLLIWLLLGLFVISFSLKREAKSLKINFAGVIRVTALAIFLGNNLYLTASYYNLVPFTGRLLYGLGLDSVGESLGFIFLIVMMGLKNKDE